MPKEVLKILTGYFSRYGCGNDVAVDVGCGSGQSTFCLGEYFSQCTGVDISKAQVGEAGKKCDEEGHKNVVFIEGSGMDLPLGNSSANAITIAQAWHWLPDPVKFYSECNRVLKPMGCLAVYGYGNGQLLNDPCNALVRDFYTNTLQGCWHKERRHIDNEYAEVDLPFANTERHDIEMTKTFSLENFIGYLSSWSGYQQYCEVHPANVALQTLQDKLQTELSKSDASSSSDILVETKFPLFIILGQKKTS